MKRAWLACAGLLAACSGHDGEGTAEQAVRSSRRYVVIGDAIPNDLGRTVFEGGGAVRELLPEAGVAIVSSPDPAFVRKARALRGVTAVIPDLPIFEMGPMKVRELSPEERDAMKLEPWIDADGKKLG